MLDFKRLLNFFIHYNPLYWCLPAFNCFEINCYDVSEKSRRVYSEKRKTEQNCSFRADEEK